MGEIGEVSMMMRYHGVLRKDIEAEADKISNNSNNICVEVKKCEKGLGIIVNNKERNKEYKFIGGADECLIFLKGVSVMV